MRIWNTTSETSAIGCTASNRSFQIGEGIGVIINFLLEKMTKKIRAFLTHNWFTMGRFWIQTSLLNPISGSKHLRSRESQTEDMPWSLTRRRWGRGTSPGRNRKNVFSLMLSKNEIFSSVQSYKHAWMETWFPEESCVCNVFVWIKVCIKNPLWLPGKTHAKNPSAQETETGRSEWKHILSYMVSSRPAWSTRVLSPPTLQRKEDHPCYIFSQHQHMAMSSWLFCIM